MLAFYLSLIDQEASRTLFETLYEQHRFTMLAVAMRILRHRQRAEDAVHDAFLRILENIDQIGAIECNKMRSYIVIIVRNIALDQLRQQNRRGELPLPEYGDDLQDDGIDLEQDLLDREQAADIHTHLRALGQPFLDIMILKMVHGFKSREISRMLQIPESTVRVYLQRGKKRLMKKLEDEGDVDPVQA